MDAMDLDLDMDVDVELVPDEPIMPDPDPRDTSNLSEGEVDDDSDTFVPTKIHIKGLDSLNPDDVKAYVEEHFPASSLERLEWIDDSSANLLFPTEAAASQALLSLSLESIPNITRLAPRRLLPSKPFFRKPEVTLRVRPAVLGDKKEAGAASRSRFYLLNPEYDPEERRKRNETRRYRDRNDDSRFRRRPRDTRDDDPVDNFDVSMYDDDTSRTSNNPPRPLACRRSHTPTSDRDERLNNRGKELFPEGTTRRNGTRMDRSTSPIRAGGRGQAMGDYTSDGSSTPDRNRDRARAIKSRLSRGHRAKELFPDNPATATASASGRLGDGVEDAATLLAKGITLPLMDGNDDAPVIQTRKLHDRINAPGKGKLADRISSPNVAVETAFNIRGTASQRSLEQGFAIKGASKSVKELFPEKFGSNAGKELFADRLEGRSRRRQRAGDLFD